MNRIVLIGNGFDLAHGLPTRYEDFINWYWDQRVEEFSKAGNISKDCLCSFEIGQPHTWYEFYNQFISPFGIPKGKDIIESVLKGQYGVKMKHSFSPFFQSIIKSIETKGWVDIENEYYKLLTKFTLDTLQEKNLNKLNEQLDFITKLLIKYLETISSSMMRISSIENSIYSPIKPEDISIEGQNLVDEYVNDWSRKNEIVLRAKMRQYGLDEDDSLNEIRLFKEDCDANKLIINYPQLFMLPDHVLLLNFNYTYTADTYDSYTRGSTIHIHGEINEPKSVIFGYGDELDKNFQQLQNLNENECLRNIKSIRYLESDNYRNVLRFLESAPFQVFIMGHSCGNSDRTLLNTVFEHKNCISIKPYYYQKDNGSDNYLDIIQNISRNFTNMKLMRDRVVNKTYCEPLPQANS